MPYNGLLKDGFYIKIIILYVLNNYGRPLTNQALTDIIIEEVDIDYFDFQKCLYELLSVSYVKYFEEETADMYDLTEEGKKVSVMFEKRIPYLIRQKLDTCIKNKLESLEPRGKVEADVTVSHRGQFGVYLKIYETGDLLFELNMNVGSRELAYKTKDYFLENAEKIYRETTENIMRGIN